MFRKVNNIMLNESEYNLLKTELTALLQVAKNKPHTLSNDGICGQLSILLPLKFKRYCFVSWAHYSGDIMFPIPVPKFKLFDLTTWKFLLVNDKPYSYYCLYPKWEGYAFLMRINLIEHMLNCLEHKGVVK